MIVTTFIHCLPCNRIRKKYTTIMKQKKYDELICTEMQNIRHELWKLANWKILLMIGCFKRCLVIDHFDSTLYGTLTSRSCFFQNYRADQHLRVSIRTSNRNDQLPEASAAGSSVRKYMPSIQKYIFSNTSHFNHNFY